MADETATIDAPATTPETPAAPDTSWQQAIPTEYAKDKAWEPLKAKGLGDVLKGYAEAQKVVSSSIRLPAKDAPPAEVAKVKARLVEAGLMGAAPATPADYKFDRPKVAEQLGWDDGAEAMMRGVWHEAGLTNDQVVKLIDAYGKFGGQKLQNAEEHGKATKAELEQEWGAEYKDRVGGMFRMIDTTGQKYGISELLESTGLIMNANVVRWLADLAQGRGEHSAMDTGTTGTTQTDFDRRHTELLNEMSKANPGSPRAKELDAALESLLKQRYPG